MAIRLYHPNLGREYLAANEKQAAVLAESGWKPAPEPEASSPAHAPEPTVYEPIKPRRSSRKSDEESAEND